MAGFEFTKYVTYEDNGNIIAIRGLNCKNGSLDLRDVKYIDNSDFSKLSRSKLYTGDILYTYVGTVGEVAVVDKNDKYYLAPNVSRIRLSKDYNSDFIKQLLGSKKFYNQIVFPLIATSSQPALSMENLRKFKLKVPSIREQTKIASLLNAIDERIATQNKIIEDLKKLKVAIIEKMFCSPNQEQPMCRIKGFKQPLTTYKLGSFCSRIVTKNKDAKCSLVLTIAAQYGLVNQESFFNKSVASENLTGYYLLQKGEFAYNRSYSMGYDWGAVKRLDNYDKGVLSTLYICFKINETIVDSDYLAYYFESSKWHRGLSNIAGEGARNHGLLNVSVTDYFNTQHRFPPIEEQKTIAKMLNSITEKESEAVKLGECYQKQKQYLLRKMFI